MKDKKAYVILALIVGLLVSLSFSFGLFTGLEYYLEDTLFQKKAVSSDLVIVAIDDDSIQKIGQWPWRRDVYAKFMNSLNANPPKSLGVDIVWSEESRYGKEDDSALSKALEESKYKITLATEATSFEIKSGESIINKRLSPIYQVKNGNVNQGLVNIITDSDSVVRRFPLVSKDESNQDGDNLKSFSYSVLKNGDIDIPKEKDLHNVNRIAFVGPTNTIRRIPFYRLFEDETALKQLEGKIVLLGATAENLHDTKPTPLSRGTEMPGVEIHGNIANMLINGDRLESISKSLNIVWIFIAAIVSALIFIFVENLSVAIGINVLIALIYAVFVVVLFDTGKVANLIHIELSVILTSISCSVYRVFVAEKEKRQMKKTFAKYVSPAVLEQIVAHPEKVTLGGEEKIVTVLFSDIRSFTSISERTKPKELVRILNTYFSGVTNKIIENDGVLDKYIGDAIMAFWGAPIDDDDQADNAVRAGMSMLEELKRLNEDFKKNGDPEIEIGIGIYTGPAIVGNVGSEHRFDYTVIGDTVNAASRLEGLNKEYKSHLIIGESTKNLLKNKYNIKSLGEATVKGKAESINIFSVE